MNDSVWVFNVDSLVLGVEHYRVELNSTVLALYEFVCELANESI
mgnify:CR=1 FL=1